MPGIVIFLSQFSKCLFYLIPGVNRKCKSQEFTSPVPEDPFRSLFYCPVYIMFRHLNPAYANRIVAMMKIFLGLYTICPGGSLKLKRLYFKLLFYFIDLYPEPLVGFDQVVNRFAGVQDGCMILSSNLGPDGCQGSLGQAF